MQYFLKIRRKKLIVIARFRHPKFKMNTLFAHSKTKMEYAISVFCITKNKAQ